MSADQQTQRTTEDDGLQVVADHIEGTEVMSVSTLPEVAIPDTPVVFFDKEKDYPETVDFDVARTASGDSVEQNVAPVARSWGKRRRLRVAAAVFVVIAVALGVGLGLGLSKKGESGSDDSQQSTDADLANDAWDASLSKSNCSKTFCKKSLSATVGGADSSSLYLAWINTTDNGRIACSATDGLGFSPCPGWRDDSSPSSVSGTPAIVSWKDNGTERIDIFSVGADGSLSNNFHRDVSLFGDQKGYLWGNWTEVTKDAAMPVPCRPNENEAHVLFIRPSNGSLAHVFWNSDKEEWEVRNGTVADPLKMAPDTLVVGCQLSGDLIFDVYGYKTDSATMVLREIVLGITGENSYGSELVAGDGVRTIDVGFDDKFMGQPFLSQASATHYDVFALGEDGKMYHYIRSPQSTPKQQPLEGTFISTPAAVSVNLDTLVVVAVGSNGHLKYGSINGLDWNGWEDMDIIAHGAPLLMELGGKIFMVADLDGYGLAYVSWDAQDGWRQHRKPEKI